MNKMKSEQGGIGTGSIPHSIVQYIAAAQPLPQGQPKHPDQRELRKNEGTTLIQYRKIAMTVVLSSFFQDNNNKRRKKKSLRSGSGIRNWSAKAEGIPTGEGGFIFLD